MKLNKVLKSALVCSVLGLTSLQTQALTPDLGDPSCESLLLVSSWTRRNVKIYDGCSGEFIKDLDSQNLINGPLGILQAPNGDVLVVSEPNERLIKYDFRTLTEGKVVMGDDPTTEEIEDNFISTPIAAVMDGQGNMYAASFGNNNVVKIDPTTWTITEEILPKNNGIISGIDVGIALDDNGDLYLPGWTSNNVVKVNVNTKQASSVVSAGKGGLENTRGVLINGSDILVSGEKNDKIISYNKSTGNVNRTVHQVDGPTGMQKDGDNHFIVATPNSVLRISLDGSSVETIVQPGAGSLAGATNVYRLYKTNDDNDNDGLKNDDEVNIYQTDPENPDTDGDTLTDGDEVLNLQTNPLKADSDDDGMPDAYEIEHGLNAIQNDATADKDSDGLSNLGEYQAQSDPNNPDTDGDGVLDGEDATPLVPNSAPAILGTPDASVLQDQTYQFQPEVTYAGDLATITLAINNLPSWASFDQQTGEISGTPANDDVGTSQSITMTATNGHHNVELEPFTIEVVNVNDAPQLLKSIPDVSAKVKKDVSINLASYFTDIDNGDTLTFAATGLPTGITLATNGNISGSSNTAFEGMINVTVSDQAGESVTDSFELEIKKKKSSGSTHSFFILLTALFLMRRRAFQLFN